jgi:hypothetical protein
MSSYLEDNLLPLVLTIKPKKTESHILSALNLADRISPQSILIAFGERIEKFWNTVISDSLIAENLIEKNNLINVNGRDRQIDHLFRLISETWYLESKCNLNFDSEKVRASNDKIKDISGVLGVNVKSGYFVPVVPEISKSEKTKYNKKGVEVYGVNWMIETINAPFTSEEYFTFLKEVVTPVLVEKGL